MTKRRIVVIGGGPAGLMAAGQVAEAGADVLLLEKRSRPGRKLCITGKGRCNITNIAELSDFIGHFGTTGRFLRQAFTAFFAPDLTDFLEKLGLELVTERGGRIFPASGKAPDVLRVLLKWVTRCGVEIERSSAVDKLSINDGAITGVVSNGRKITCDAVILATGGASYPDTGSTGDGYRLAASVGHAIVPIRPALVPLEIGGDVTGEMAGLTLRNVKVRLFINGKRRREAFGEVGFTELGVNGAVINTLSGEVVDALSEGAKVTLSIDLKPALDEQKLDARLLRDFASRSRERIDSLLRGLLPREMVPLSLKVTGIPPDRMASAITAGERRRLKSWFKEFRLEVTGHRPIAEAIITAGGIDTREVNPRSMESRLVKGLYFAGEVLDVNADTGGYNLQAAFSTGWLAGRSAASIPSKYRG
ncbi:MAG: NAD(P)/FAD-dependent oxidoreductase [Thermodesulfobacteriota bacterium]